MQVERFETQPAAEPGTYERPRSVTVLAGLHLLQSLALLVFELFWMNDNGSWSEGLKTAEHMLPLVLFDNLISRDLILLLAGLGVLIAVALIGLHPWAWRAAITLQGLGLLAGILAYVQDEPNYLGMLMGVLLVLYLNRRDVQEAFRVRKAAER